MKDGDIYFWRYKDESGPFSYHCKSRIAVVSEAKLYDTYWHDNSGSSLDASRVVLTYKGNKEEMREIGAWQIPYYEETEVVDMRHSNSMKAEVYVRKETKKSRARMLEYTKLKRDEYMSNLRVAMSRIDALDEACAILTNKWADIEDLHIP